MTKGIGVAVGVGVLVEVGLGPMVRVGVTLGEEVGSVVVAVALAPVVGDGPGV